MLTVPCKDARRRNSSLPACIENPQQVMHQMHINFLTRHFGESTQHPHAQVVFMTPSHFNLPTDTDRVGRFYLSVKPRRSNKRSRHEDNFFGAKSPFGESTNASLPGRRCSKFIRTHAVGTWLNTPSDNGLPAFTPSENLCDSTGVAETQHRLAGMRKINP